MQPSSQLISETDIQIDTPMISEWPYIDNLDHAVPANPDRISNRYAPIILTKPTATMPDHFAPCIAARHPLSDRVYAEELIYPDFAIPFPIFAREEDRERWVSRLGEISDRGATRQREGEWVLEYKGQHGQNYILHNVTLYPPRFDAWTSTAGMAFGTRLANIHVEAGSMRGVDTTKPGAKSGDATSVADAVDLENGTSLVNKAHQSFATAILVDSPDSSYFQHWMDRVSHILAQPSHLLSGPVIALTGAKGRKPVQELWQLTGFSEGQVLHLPTEAIGLDRLVYSSKAVLIHPYLTWRSMEMMDVPWVQRDFDPTTKKTVFYMTRSDGKAHNGGRKVLNEPDVLSAIQRVLDTRGRNETLKLFNPDEYTDISDLIATFSRDALAIVGPHGGAMMNHRFAGPGTFVLEFIPTSWFLFENWEEASLMDQTYATMVVKPEGGEHDMVIDPETVGRLLSEHLGREREDKLEMTYGWVKE